MRGVNGIYILDKWDEKNALDVLRIKEIEDKCLAKISSFAVITSSQLINGKHYEWYSLVLYDPKFKKKSNKNLKEFDVLVDFIGEYTGPYLKIYKNCKVDVEGKTNNPEDPYIQCLPESCESFECVNIKMVPYIGVVTKEVLEYKQDKDSLLYVSRDNIPDSDGWYSGLRKGLQDGSLVGKMANAEIFWREQIAKDMGFSEKEIEDAEKELDIDKKKEKIKEMLKE